MNIKNLTSNLSFINKTWQWLAIGLSSLFLCLSIQTALMNTTVYAQEDSSLCPEEIVGECDEEEGEREIYEVINKVINYLTVAVGIIAVIMIIYAGLRYVLSGGSKDGVENAKKTLLYALIGLVIVALAQTLVKWVVGQLT